MKQLILLGLIALAIGMGVRAVTVKRPAPALPPASPLSVKATDQPPTAAPPGSRHSRWVAVWTRLTPNLRDISLAPDGQTVAWVDQAGTIRRIGAATGVTLWQSTPLSDVNRVVAVAGGDVLAFSRLNPMDSDIHLFDARSGASAAAPRVSTLPVAGAIWSVVASSEGDRAYIGTGRSLIFVLPLSSAPPAKLAAATLPDRKASATPTPMGNVPPMRQIPTQGIPETLAVSNAHGVGAAAIVAGTWQDAGIRAWSADGTSLWPLHDDPRPDRTYDVHVSADGLTVVAVSSRKPHGGEPRIHVWEGRTGRLIWSQVLLDATDVHALVSAHGDVIAVSYVESTPDTTIEGQTGEIAATRKLALFNRTGNRLIPDMGGRYFAPRLVALSADGQDVTVRDDNGSLHILDAKGKILSNTALPPNPKTGRSPAIRATYSSADSRYLLLQRDDDQITLLKIVAS